MYPFLLRHLAKCPIYAQSKALATQTYYTPTRFHCKLPVLNRLRVWIVYSGEIVYANSVVISGKIVEAEFDMGIKDKTKFESVNTGMIKDFIVMDRVSFSYGKREVLSNVHLKLEAGSSYALIGKSGSGKSTLLNLLAGFLKPEQGTVMINGSEVRAPRRETAFLFQDLGLFPWQTVEEAVSMPLKLKGRTGGIHDVVMELLREMRLEDHKDKYPQELSGGERQRAALARTLIGEPDLLLMDEPTSALDAMTKEELQGIIIREQQKRTAALLFVTHDIEEAVMLGQHILLMNEDGTVSQMDNPYYSVRNAREQLGFYDECIRLRKQLKMEIER